MTWLLVGLLLLAIGVCWAFDAPLRDALGLPASRVRSGAGLLLAAGGLLLMYSVAHAADVQIPAASVRYRVQLERVAGAQFGINAPVARIAAQLHQESGWRPAAKSAYAQGLAQFTPATAAWLPQVCPQVGPPDPWDALWSIRAAVCYDAWLLDRAPGAHACDRWAMTLSAYNGGETARDREIRMMYQARDAPVVWFGQVERQRSRSAAAWSENRGYVRRILLLLEPAYLAAGWPGSRACP